MGTNYSRNLRPVKNCNVKCQEIKKKNRLYSNMKRQKKLSKVFTYEYDKAKNKYYTFLHGPSWIKNKNLKSENSKLKTKYDKKLQQYDTEFKSLAKYFMDSLFLLKNQKKVINKNKVFTQVKDNKLQTQKDNMENLDIQISTVNRNINFSKKERDDMENSLRSLKNLFYCITTLVGVSILLIIISEVKNRYGKSSIPTNIQQ
jgi:predicted RNase H-like nuclease (RuvC/YqgF family)